MIQKSYLLLYTFSILFCMILWLAGKYGSNPDIAIYAMFYGIVLPGIWMLLTGAKSFLCRFTGSVTVNNYRVCPVNIKTLRGVSIFTTALVSFASIFIAVVIASIVANINVSVGQLTSSETVLAVVFVILTQIPVGTMEEGVFRQAIPEFAEVFAPSVPPLLWAILASMLFGVLHLWAYGSVFLTISATIVGVINSLIYYGYFGLPAGDLTGIALGHAMYNISIILIPANMLLAFILPMSMLIIFGMLVSRRVKRYV